MSEYYLIPKKLARRVPSLANFVGRLEGGTFRAIFWLLRRLSLESAGWLAGSIFRLVGPRTDKAAKARANLAVAFPDASEQWREQTTREIFHHLGLAAVELVKLDQIWAQRDSRLEFVIEPGAREHLAGNRATVFVCAHVGPWQLVNLISLHCGLTISTIYAPESNPVMTELMAGLRQSFGTGLISSEEGVRPLIRELSAGHCIGMAMDTRLDTGKPIPFFGRDALTNTSAAGLALRTGAALVPIRGERLPGTRYRITVQNPLVPADPEASQKEQTLELTAQINRIFEGWIRETPEQWICLKRRWPKGHKK